MTSKTSTWFETKIQRQAASEDGACKNVTEFYAVEADSFTVAEARIGDYMEQRSAGEYRIAALKIADYTEIFDTDARDVEDIWYKAKVSIIAYDESTEKEKRTAVKHLVNAGSIDEATKKVNEMYRDTMSDYIVESVSETKILDLITLE